MISVIVPVYNVEKYIKECLKSISEQTFRDFELILVDDGSSDTSVNVAREYLENKDFKWKIIEKENGGQSSSRNEGLKQAEGEYVIFIDSDDVVSKDFLSSLYENISDDCDLSFCNFQYVKTQDPPEDDLKDVHYLDRNEFIDSFLKRTIGFVVPSMMFKRSFLLDNDLFFREKIRYSEDQLFIWEVIFKTKKAAYLPRKMYGYYLRGQSIMTGSPYEKIVNGFHVYKDFCDELKSEYPEYEKQISMILPRWELGTLYTSANLMNYEEYEKIYEMMDGKSVLSRVRGIGELKAYLLAFVSSVSPRLLYALCSRMDLNG